MTLKKDLAGQVFGELTVLSRDSNPCGKQRRTKWFCRCSCGVITSVFTHNLTGGRSERCNNWKIHPRAVRPITSECMVQGDIVRVKCSDGTQFIVDAADLDVVQSRSWFLTSNGYIYTNIKGKKCSIHRLLLSAGEYDEVDHISGDKTDNRRANLRFCTHAENQRNIRKRANSKTGYKGVFLVDGRTMYFSQIGINGRRIYLGSFTTPLEAAQVYNKASEILHAEFSNPNNVPPPPKELAAQITDRINRLIAGGFIMLDSEATI